MRRPPTSGVETSGHSHKRRGTIPVDASSEVRGRLVEGSLLDEMVRPLCSATLQNTGLQE